MHPSNWSTITAEETLTELRSRPAGLSVADVQERSARDGENRLPDTQTHRWWHIFLRQFKNPMIIVLLVAASISLLLFDYTDTLVILAAVLLNTIIGFGQEFRANKTLEQLRSLVQPKAIVLREGVETEIQAKDLVTGDLLLLQSGDRVTADARLIEVVDLLVNESALTGESLPVEKQTSVLSDTVSLAERSNMVFAGTAVVGGRAKAVVVATGTKTELGRIAQLVMQTEETLTPLQVQLSRLARGLAFGIIVLVTVLFVIGLVQGQAIEEMFKLAVALSVAAIPEGLVVSVTIILAIGMQRILKRKSLTRRLVAAETLGSVSVICSDKTGTITQGEMRVTQLVTSSNQWHVPGVKGEAIDPALQTLFEVMVLCNNAIYIPDDTEASLRGSPTERSLLQSALDHGIDIPTLVREQPRMSEIPFDSAFKYMVTAHEVGGETRVFMKGASDVVMAFCTQVEHQGQHKVLAPALKDELLRQERELTSQGVRLIALAMKTQSNTTLAREELGGFTFLGFVGMHDPIRDGAREQIEAARVAGIRTVMITGDHPQTAHAIALEAGIEIGADGVIRGSDLDAWSDEELTRRVSDISVYARVEPRHKIRIVHAWQAKGHVVAMTGDGVNDAPALKAADIGVAVGSGTEVAKQASDIVLMDNNLGTITAAIEEGRVVFENIRKTTGYLLSGSFTEIVLIGTAIVLGLPLPLLPVHILWINLVADSFPNLGLTVEPAEKGLMSQPPRARSVRVVNKQMLWFIVLVGVVTNIVLISFYLLLLQTSLSIEAIRTMMFTAVGIDTLIYVFAFRNFRQSLFHTNPFSNGWLLGGILIGFGLMFIAVTLPALQTLFEITALSLWGWVLLIMMGVLKLFLIEAIKEVFLVKTYSRTSVMR